jgi:peptidoglycan/LPS O-acetylase OafA/YrhL
MMIIGPLGSLGVLLFFIVSGFLITGLLFAERLDTGGINLRNFYVRRALRLFPALFVFLGTILVLVKLHYIAYVSGAELLACLFYARNFYGQSMVVGHLWSLSLEEQFYFCCPSALRLLPTSSILRVTAAVTSAFAIFRALAIRFDLWHLGERSYYMLPFFRLDSLLIGSCLALALACWPGWTGRVRLIMQRLPIGWLWIPLLLWSMFGKRYNGSFYQSIQLLLATLLLAQLILGQGSWSQTVFRHPVLRYTGKLSYSLYLWQQLFLLARPPSWGSWPTFPTWLLISLIVAWLSYRFIEFPVLQLKRRFEPSSSPAQLHHGDERGYLRA